MSIPENHNRFMQAALQEAIIAGESGEVPIGAVITHNNTIIAKSGNRVERDKNPTAHAEMVVIQEASKILGEKRIPECDLYVSLEPCTMCAGAIAMARVKNVIFAAQDEKGGAVLHGVKFFEQKTCHHHPVISYMKEFEEQSSTLLKTFFKQKREAQKS